MSGHENFTYGVSYLSDNYYNRFSFDFQNGSSQGFSCGFDTEEAREPQYCEWRVHVVNNPPTTNPGIKSPEYASGMMAKGTVIEFSAKVIGNDVLVNAEMYIKHKDGNWNNVVSIGTIGTDHAYHTYIVDLTEAIGDIPIEELEIAQFSLESSGGEQGENEIADEKNEQERVGSEQKDEEETEKIQVEDESEAVEEKIDFETEEEIADEEEVEELDEEATEDETTEEETTEEETGEAEEEEEEEEEVEEATEEEAEEVVE